MKEEPGQRLVIISNRLPFTATIDKGGVRYRQSAGGLATGLSTYLHSIETGNSPIRDYIWIGWPGRSIPEAHQEEVKHEAMRQFRSVPLFLSEQEMDLFYNGFCNETIWPLFHYFPTLTVYREDFWVQYKKVNLQFADVVADILRPNDVVWIHDYHLMLLPQLLRARAPQIPIGFFLHIPFPSFEIFRLLPGRWRREILEGLMEADLVGFHTYEYVQHFLQSVLRIQGINHTMRKVFTHDRIVSVDSFPMGIDFNHFAEAVHTKEVQAEREKLTTMLVDRKVILSVDRLDYTKGILNRLSAFEILLESNAAYRGKVVLIMIVVPSRVGVEQYEMMKRQIEEQVGRINGRFGNVQWTPIVYQYRHVPFDPLVAFYTVSDVALVTPLRDGMNLVAKEYVATRKDDTGVLILSEMAGAVKELGEAIVINPNNLEEIAEALREALEMPLAEQQRRNRVMKDRIRRYDVVRWANDFVIELIASQDAQESFYAKVLSETSRQPLLNEYARSKRRGIFLDYDGTLVPFVRHPEQAAPSNELLGLLKALTKDESTTVTIISGRDKNTLQGWFGTVPVRLVAEHGMWIRERGTQWTPFKKLNNSWKPSVLPIFELYSDRLPGSFIEEKDYSVVWHYRGADPEHSETLAAELMDNLVSFTANIDVQVLRGNKIVEVRAFGVTKGSVGQHLIKTGNYDFVMFIGDDWTDEDLFKVLSPPAISIKVGMASTHAQYMVHTVQDVLRLLLQLSHLGGPADPLARAPRLSQSPHKLPKH